MRSHISDLNAQHFTYTNPVDDSEDQNSVVFSKILIGNDGTKDGCHVAEELKEHIETCCTSVS